MGKLVLHRRAKRAQPEQQLHKAVAAYLRLALRPPTIWTTIGHGGGGKARGGQLKAMGVQPGWPDILVIHPAGVLGIELKVKGGRLSPEQVAMSAAFAAAGAVYRRSFSVEHVEQELRSIGIPLHATAWRRVA